MAIKWTISWPAPGSLTATGGSVTWVVQVGAKGNDGATGNAGPSLIADTTALGLLTHIADPAFLLVGAAAGDRARKLTPTGWGLSNLLASVPAGRVPFSDVSGAVTSSAGLVFNSGTGTLSAQNIHPFTGNLRLGTGTSAGVQIGTGSIGTGSDAPVLLAGNNPFGFGLTIQRGDNLSPADLYARNLFSRDGLYVWNGSVYTFRNDLGRTRIGAAGVPTDDGSSSLQVAGAALLTSTGSANGGLTIQPPTGTDVAGIFRVLHSNGLPAFRVNTSGYTVRIGPDGASSLVEISSVGRYMTVPSGGFELRGDSFAAFTITNPTLRWPNASPNLSLVQDSAGVLRVGNGSTGYGNLIAGNLLAVGGTNPGVYFGGTSSSDVLLRKGSAVAGKPTLYAYGADIGNWAYIAAQGLYDGPGDIIWATNATSQFCALNTSLTAYRPIGVSQVNLYGSGVLNDAELTRISPGFVGLGSPTNKVSVGHNGTAGWVSTAAGNLILAPWTGQIWLGSVGGAGMRNSAEMGLAENASLNWTNGTNNFFSAPIDARIRRSSANVLDVDTGTNSSFADVRLRNLTLSGRLGFATSDNAPANTTTPLLWMNVQVGGLTYKMPLYQ